MLKPQRRRRRPCRRRACAGKSCRHADMILSALKFRLRFKKPPPRRFHGPEPGPARDGDEAYHRVTGKPVMPRHELDGAPRRGAGRATLLAPVANTGPRCRRLGRGDSEHRASRRCPPLSSRPAASLRHKRALAGAATSRRTSSRGSPHSALPLPRGNQLIPGCYHFPFSILRELPRGLSDLMSHRFQGGCPRGLPFR